MLGFRSVIGCIALSAAFTLLAANNNPLISTQYVQNETAFSEVLPGDLFHTTSSVRDGMLDSSGSVYLLTSTDIDGTIDHYTLGKYASDGSLIWTHEYADPSEGTYYNGVHAMVEGGNGNIYIVGHIDGNMTTSASNDGINTDLFVQCISPTDGAPVWTGQYGNNAASDMVVSVAIDNNDALYLVGTTTSTVDTSIQAGFVTQISGSDGTQNWYRQYVVTDGSSSMTAITIDGNGDVISMGDVSGDIDANIATNGSLYVMKHQSDGTLLWTKQLETQDAYWPSGLTVDADNNIYFTAMGFDPVYFHAGYISKLSGSDASVMWEDSFGAGGFVFPSGLRYGRDGGLYLLAGFDESFDVDNDPLTTGSTLVRKYSTDGTHLWDGQFDVAYGYSSDYAGTYNFDIASDNSIYLFGGSYVYPDDIMHFARLERGFTFKHPAGTLEVADIDAVDADGDTLTFSIGGISSDQFTIDAQTGVLSFVSPPVFAGSVGIDTYYLDVSVADGQGGLDTLPVSVEVIAPASAAGLQPSVMMYLLN